VYIHKDGSKYEGNWEEDLQHGDGMILLKFLRILLGILILISFVSTKAWRLGVMELLTKENIGLE